MKSRSMLVVVALLMQSCQPPDSVPSKSGSAIRHIIAVGNLETPGSVQLPGYWQDGIWQVLPVVDAEQPSAALAVVTIGSETVVAGYSTSSTGVKIAGIWRNGEWHPYGVSSQETNSEAVSIAIDSNNNVYVGGYLVDSGGIERPGYWKNGIWRELHQSSAKDGNNQISSLVIQGVDVYSVGWSGPYSDPTFGNLFVSGIWKNDDPQTLSSGFGSSRLVGQILFQGSDRYILGMDILNKEESGYWKNETWTPLMRIHEASQPIVSSVSFDGSNMYVVGISSETGKSAVPVIWTNGLPSLLPCLDDTNGGVANVIVSKGKHTVVGGFCKTDKGIEVPVLWVDGKLSVLPTAGARAVLGIRQLAVLTD